MQNVPKTREVLIFLIYFRFYKKFYFPFFFFHIWETIQGRGLRQKNVTKRETHKIFHQFQRCHIYMKSVATTDFCLTALIADQFFNYAT